MSLLESVKKIRNLNPQTAFLIISLLFGLSFAVITPPFQSPDEIVHFYRAYEISELHFMPQKVGNAYGGYLPQSVPVAAYMSSQGVQQNPNIRYNFGVTRALLHQQLNPQKTTFVASANSYSPLSYIPQLPGIYIGRILELPPIIILLLGRISDVVFWSISIYFAIKFIPIGKWSLAILGLTPMAVFLSGSVTIDTMLNASAFMLLAYALKVRYSESIKIKDKIVLIILATCIALVKIVYLPLIAVLFIITAKSFGGLWKKASFISMAVIVPTLFGLGWLKAISPVQAYSVKYTSETVGFQLSPTQQENVSLSSPVSYGKVLWNTYLTNNGDHITNEFAGTLGSLDVALPTYLVTAEYVVVVLVLISEPATQIIFLRKYKIFLLVSAIFMTIAISSAMYLYSSPYKYPIIVGLQGRYFIPLSILAIPFLANLFKGIKISQKSRRSLVFNGSVIILGLSLIFTAFRYYAFLGRMIAHIH